MQKRDGIVVVAAALAPLSRSALAARVVVVVAPSLVCQL